MLQLHELTRSLESALQSIDLDVYLPRRRRREPRLPLATLLAAIVWFGHTGMHSFKRYVGLILSTQLLGANLSYSRWTFWRNRLAGLVEALATMVCWKTRYVGTALIDSTSLPACGIQRERDHKCFLGHASKAKSSLGWFYGHKLHLITSDRGTLLRFWFTTATVHDVRALDRPGYLDGLTGMLVGDNAYTSHARRDALRDQGVYLMARPSKALHKMLDPRLESLFTRRWRIETVIGQIKEHCGLRLAAATRSLNTLKTLVYGALILYTLDWERDSA